MDTYKKAAEAMRAEVVTINGVDRLKDPAGIILKKPYEEYVDEFDEVREMICEYYSELRRYVRMLMPVFTFKMDTFATGCGYIFINPYFFDGLIEKSKESEVSGGTWWYGIAFVTLHEIFHNLYSHMADSKRYGSRYTDSKRRNIAMDYTINWIIEQLYGMEGATEMAGGCISDAYAGMTWNDVYDIIEDTDENLKKIPFTEIYDEYNKADSADTDQTGGGMPSSPQNANIKYSNDFKDGYASMYNTIKSVIESARKDIEQYAKNGNDVNGVQYVIDCLIDAALKMGIRRDEIIKESYNFPSGNESYDKGVKAAWAEAIGKMQSLIRKIGNSSNSEYSGGSNINKEELKNAVDDLYNKLQSGEPSETNNDSDSDDNKSKPGQDGKDSQKPSNGKGNPGQDGKDSNSEGNGEGKSQGEDGNDGSSSSKSKPMNSPMPGNTKGSGPIDPNTCTEEEKERVMKEILDERGMKAEEDTESDRSKANALRDIVSKSEAGDDIKKKIIDEIDKIFPIPKVNTGVDWKEKIEEFVSECQMEQAKTFNIDSVAKTIPFYRTNKTIFVEDTLKEKLGSNHIVIGLDNSGSVCSSGSVPDFLGALLEIFEKALDDSDMAVDVIQFDYGIQKCTRLVHLQDQDEDTNVNQVKQVATATNGGTEYSEVMKEFQLLALDFGEDNDTVHIDDVSIAENFRPTEIEGTYETIELSPAMCAIIFTDTDFYDARKYEELDSSLYDKMLFVILSDKTGEEERNDKYRILKLKREGWEYK